MLLVVKANKPLMTGAVSFRSKFVLPPGNRDVMQKLVLNGAFGISGGRFTTPSLQDKIDTLSKKGRGKPDEVEDQSAVSNLRGSFALSNSVIRFSKLSFDVPGAQVHLAGQYGLADEQLDFNGTLRLQAKVSQTMTGIKSFLLKAVDPLFEKKGAGAEIPIRIGGTRTSPAFALDVKRVFGGK